MVWSVQRHEEVPRSNPSSLLGVGVNIERKKIPPGEFLRKRKTIQMWRGYKIEQDMIEPVEEPESHIELNGEHVQDIIGNRH